MADKTDEFIPRSYQIDLYRKAIERNSIIFLPTGAGKTYIAVMVIKELSASVRKPYNEGGKRTIFIVNTIPLVIQQSEYIARLTGLSCGAYSGDLNTDFWSGEKWSEEIIEHEVLVMTAQIFVQMLSQGIIHLNRVNLIIFDECHRAVGDHPMRQIMRYFEHFNEEEQPRVLALTATLLNSNVPLNKVETQIHSLQVTFHATIATVTSNSCIKTYYVKPDESIVEFIPYCVPDLGKRVEHSINDLIMKINLIHLHSDTLDESDVEFQRKPTSTKLKAMIQDICEQLSDAGLYGASCAVLFHLIQLELRKKFAKMYNQVYIQVLDFCITELIMIRKLFEDEMKEYTELQRIYKYSSNKIIRLFEVLKDYNQKNNENKFSCIVFVKRRYSAKVLYHILKNLHTHDDEFRFLLPDYMVGFANAPDKTSKESLCIAKWNKEALRRFRNRQSNCLIATDVIDEGIDIPTCTLIVRYDVPQDVRAYIQSKGRARHINSQYIVLIPSTDDMYRKRHYTYKCIESVLQNEIYDQSEPSKNEIEQMLYSDYSIPPYIVTMKDGTKSILKEQGAIPLINLYCANLYKSTFVKLRATWKLDKLNDKGERLYRVTLKLPAVSVLKTTIVGDKMCSIKAAKRAAAMKACIELHKLGEITDAFKPLSGTALIANVDYLFPNWQDEDKDKVALVGTYKNKELHKLKYPSALYGAFPMPNTNLQLHILHAKPVYTTPTDNRYLVFYNLLCNDAGFGILSTKPMPEVPSFPIFMNVGELNVDIKVNHAEITLSKERIDMLKVFHTLIFADILQIIKSFMVFDVDNLDNSYLVVPVNEMWEIDWDIVRKYQKIERIPPTAPFHFQYSDYDLALVTPTYRGFASTYIVTQICNELTPDSYFPTEEFYTYAAYYKERHDVTISNTKQPMLEVKAISKKINCIRPRGMSCGLSKRKRADILEEFDEHLVPELCNRINFPALYWLKSTMLPSIIHRLCQLLIADDLRTTIIMEAQLGLLNTPKWPPLTITQNEKKEISESLSEISHEENGETFQSTESNPVLNGLDIDVLDTESTIFPWTKDQEPPDLYRNAEKIQLIDIEYYYQFMMQSVKTEVEVPINRKIEFKSKTTVSVPALDIFSKNRIEGPSPVEIMHALCVSGKDVFDLERLEVLGDSFLKFIATLFLYIHFPNLSEGRLTTLKGKIIGNRNLYYCGSKKCIPGRLKVDEFVPNSNFIAPAYTTHRQLQAILLENEVSPNVLYEIFIPPEEQFTGYISQNTKYDMREKVSSWHAAETQTGMEHFLGVQVVANKTVADSVEALIGVYLTSMGIKEATKFLQWFQILPQEMNVKHMLYDPPEVLMLSQDIDRLMPWASYIETRLGYKFQNRALLLQAFTHPSYTANDVTECYERLEFLGDSILDFLITCFIYEKCGNLNPGAVTDLRSALVNNITFACLSVRYGLHTALLFHSMELNESIDRFVKFQTNRNFIVDDELLYVLLQEECNIAEHVDVPKILGDIFESVIGAIYFDTKKDLSKTWEIIYSLMHKEIEEYSMNVPRHPIRVLHEVQGARPIFSEATVVEETKTVMVPLTVTIDGNRQQFHGFGVNKAQAKCAAAKLALRHFLIKN